MVIKKGKLFVLVLLLGVFSLATNAFALTAGTPISFSDILSDTMIPVSTTTWTHTLDAGDVVSTTPPPELSDGPEPLDISIATLLLNLDYTPGVLYTSGPFSFQALMSVATLDGNVMSESMITTVPTFSSTPVTGYSWSTVITNPAALAAIGDRTATISLTQLYGTINDVNSSALYGSGTVAPEPVSMLLVGIGLAGLPFARRFRGVRRHS